MVKVSMAMATFFQDMVKASVDMVQFYLGMVHVS
jgi:hypothetical protein